MKELVLVGTEAWTREEYEAEQRRLQAERDYERSPERLAQKAAYMRRWESARGDQRRVYKNDWMRRARAQQPHVVGSLHSLACTGPTIPTGCVCRKQGTSKITVWDKPPRQSS